MLLRLFLSRGRLWGRGCAKIERRAVRAPAASDANPCCLQQPPLPASVASHRSAARQLSHCLAEERIHTVIAAVVLQFATVHTDSRSHKLTHITMLDCVTHCEAQFANRNQLHLSSEVRGLSSSIVAFACAVIAPTRCRCLPSKRAHQNRKCLPFKIDVFTVDAH